MEPLSDAAHPKTKSLKLNVVDDVAPIKHPARLLHHGRNFDPIHRLLILHAPGTESAMATALGTRRERL